MNKPTCSTKDCTNPRYGHGMCSKHYQQAKRAGTLPTSKACTIKGCNAPQKARAWCNTHWLRWRDHGDPMATVEIHYDTPEEAFTARTVRHPNGCLEWTGADNGDEYGKIKVRGENTYVHRYAWEQVNGPIPAGTFIDHECRNPRCCEHTHLRLATNKQNLENRGGPQKNNLSSGVRGVTARGEKWIAQLGHNGRVFYCGIYDELADA